MIRSLDHSQAMNQFVQNIEVPWHGERLPGYTLKCLLQLLDPKRRPPTAKEKQAILKAQDRECALCGGIFDYDEEFDHVAPLRETLKAQPQTYQAVCSSCHAEKTKAQQTTRSIESRFSKRSWDQYVLSPRPPPLVWQPNRQGEAISEEESHIEFDVIRCRRSSLSSRPLGPPSHTTLKAIQGVSI